MEGKGYEGFGLPLGEHLQAAATNERSGTPARVKALVSGFFGQEVDERLATVGYQLLSALAGTLAEAKKAGAVSAIVLVHEFVFEHSDELARERNLAQLETFVKALGAGPDRRRLRRLVVDHRSGAGVRRQRPDGRRDQSAVREAHRRRPHRPEGCRPVMPTPRCWCWGC